MPVSPQDAGVDPAEFLAYLRCREEAWLARREGGAAPAGPADRLREADEQRVFPLARAFLAGGDATALFGEDGELTFDEDYAVPGRWACRADAVFRPVGGGPVTLIRFATAAARRGPDGSPAAGPEQLFDLAYRRFVLTACGTAVGNCGLVSLRAAYRQAGDRPAAAELFAYQDLTALLYRACGRGGETYADLVVREGLEAPSFLSGPAPAPWAFTSCANGASCRWLQRAVELPSPSVFDLPRVGRRRLDALLASRVLDLRAVPDYADLTARQRRSVEVARTGTAHRDRAGIASRLRGLRYPLSFLDLATRHAALPPGPGARPCQRLPFQYALHVRRRPGAALEHRAAQVVDLAAGAETLLGRLAADLGPGDGTVVVWDAARAVAFVAALVAMRPRYAGLLAALEARVWDLGGVFRDGLVEVPSGRGGASREVVLGELARGVPLAELPIGDPDRAELAWVRLGDGAFDVDDAEDVRRDLRAYGEACSLGMAHLLDWVAHDPADAGRRIRR